MAYLRSSLKPIWTEQCGSDVAQAAAVALLSAALIAALLGSGRQLTPPVQHAFGCVIGVLSGGGACPGAGAAGTGSTTDPPWWQKLWHGLGDGWDWLFKHVLSPVGNWLGQAWSWLWAEHQWTWWKDFLAGLSHWGPLGFVAAGILGFAMDLLFGVGMDGKFRWGMVIFATLTSIASIFGVGLLAKIPVLGRLFEAGGLLSKAFEWFKGLPLVDKFLGTAFGRWLTKLGSEGIADLLQGKFGQWLVNLGRGLEKVPVLGPILKAIEDNKLVKTLGNYAWRLLTNTPFGIVGDVLKTIIKDVISAPPNSPLGQAVQIFKRLFVWKGARDIIKWLLNPKWPLPF